MNASSGCVRPEDLTCILESVIDNQIVLPNSRYVTQYTGTDAYGGACVKILASSYCKAKKLNFENMQWY